MLSCCIVVQATESPFINAIFDKEPLDQFVWGRVALLGEAAHPTTPHGLRRFVSLFCALPSFVVLLFRPPSALGMHIMSLLILFCACTR